jgi:hypothetical protein
MESTGFLNTKRRVIYRTASGKYAARSAKGLVYNPKAKYHKSPGGTERATKYLKNTMAIPSPIRPKFNRATRKNYGERRGKYAARVKGVRVLPVKRRAYLTELFEGHKPKRPVGRPRKSVAWNLPNPMGAGMRKVRKNKGAKRAARA